MIRLLCALLCFLLIPGAYAANTIQFFAQVENEVLAEEAVLLVHCLSARSGNSWEFSGEARGETFLRIREKDHAAEGVYKNGKAEQVFRLKSGEADKVCEELEKRPPDSEVRPFPGAEEPKLPDAGEVEEASAGSKKAWLWAGLGAAAIAGFFWYRSKQPTHRSIEMY